MTIGEEVLFQAAQDMGVSRDSMNSRSIDRLLASKLLHVKIMDEKLPLSSKRYFLTKAGRRQTGELDEY